MKIPWDLEAIPLQIKTDSALGSDERIWVWMYNEDGSFIGTVIVKFSSTMQYWIGSCTSTYTDLRVQPPVEVDKIWTITKTETAVIITCNNVEVLNYLFADGSNSDCVKRWDGNVVEQILFDSSIDTASDFYRAGRGLDLIHTTSSSAVQHVGLMLYHTSWFNYNKLIATASTTYPVPTPTPFTNT